MDIVIIYLNFNSEYHDKCTFAKSHSRLHKMPRLAILCIMEKLDVLVLSTLSTLSSSCIQLSTNLSFSKTNCPIEITNVGQQ